jgi:hypothetical protein
VAAEIASRAALARWKWKAERARAAIAAEFGSRNQQLIGEWCDFDESMSLSESAERLGSSQGRIIQRWPTKPQLIDALEACGPALRKLGHVYVLIMDLPDAAWIRVSGELLSSELARAAGEWLTDGFIAFDSRKESLLSVDVEERDGESYIETTVIGDGFGELCGCFSERGPSPLRIAGPSESPNVS